VTRETDTFEAYFHKKQFKRADHGQWNTLQETAYCESNGHVTYDVTRP